MLQAVIKKGKVISDNIPAPIVSNGSLLIKVVNSCISAGTEMMGVASSGKSLINRALEQPENVKKVLNMAKTDGILSALNKVKGKLEGGFPTGYSISGIIIAVGEGVKNFKIGDRVAAAGAGLANHAEYVDVPQNLVMKLPKDLSFKYASTVTLGGIALQGIRRANLKLGDYCVVVGAGILGLLSIQMLKTSGIRVIAIDVDEDRLKIAEDSGAEIIINPLNDDAVKKVLIYTGGYGTDAVIFTAATTSNQPLSDSFKMCRKKGQVILVGVSGMEIDRNDIYPKELDFKISTSYGPGRYDNNYEEKGLDYPYAYVRWTENRNMIEYLRLISTGVIKLDKLINAKYRIEDVSSAFEALKNPKEKPLMVILEYGDDYNIDCFDGSKLDRKIVINSNPINKDIINVALIGAGGFATEKHLPNIQKLKNQFNLYSICNRTGLTGKNIAQNYGANYVTSNIEDIFNDPNVDLVMITTRHKDHAELVLRALESGKHVFVEKPLATRIEELDKIRKFYTSHSIDNKPKLFVGYNRRFSKYALEIKSHTKNRINPLFIHYRMNAGYIPLDHWVHEDGGRMVGEFCHLIDLMTFFTESQIESVLVESLAPINECYSSSDNKSIILKYKDGSICSIDYFAVGSNKFPKEYMEVHFDEKTIVLEDYKTLHGYGVKTKKIENKFSEKGHLEELLVLFDTLKGKKEKWPIELWDLFQTTEVSFLI